MRRALLVAAAAWLAFALAVSWFLLGYHLTR